MKNKPFYIIPFLLKLQKSQKPSDGGYVLVIAIGTILALSGLLVVYGQSNRVQKTASDSNVDSSSGFYAAEAGLNLRAQDIRDIFLNRATPTGNPPQSAKACLGSDTSIQGTEDFECQIFNFASSSENRQGYVASTYLTGGAQTLGVVPRGDRFENLNMLENSYSLYSLSFKEGAADSQASAILQMDIKARQIPMFQFAAFYKNDLEILPGPNMNLNGPIHTDRNLYLGSGAVLSINSQITVAGNIFSRRQSNNDTYASNRVRIRNANNTAWIQLVQAGTGSTTATTNRMDPVRIASAFGTQVQIGTDQISIPTPDILDSNGEYFNKADIRINYTPTASNVANYQNDVPFTIQAINRTDSSGDLIPTPTTVSLTEAQRRSLRQPVLVSPQSASIPVTAEDFIAINDANRGSDGFTVAQTPNYNICTPTHGYTVPTTGGDSGKIVTNFGNTTPLNNFRDMWKNFTWQQQKDLAEFAHGIMVARLQAMQTPLLFSTLSTAGSITGLTFTGLTIPASIPAGSHDTVRTRLNSLTPNQLASLPYRQTDGGIIVQRCFVSAPLIDIGRDVDTHTTPFRFRNQREGRDMRILQLNVKSMVLWNSEGQYLDGSSLASTNQLLYATAPVDNSAPANSFQRLGMAARDNSDGGLVVHATINTATYTNAGTNQSRYGFALVDAHQLPGLGFANSFNGNDPTGLTFASDQAVYMQGNYNTRNKQPSGILSDSLNVLSNRCLNTNMGIVHQGSGANCDVPTGAPAANRNALETVVNAAFLAGNDISTSSYYNGGLENYPRFLEQWGGIALRYRGSFVNISPPLRVSGAQGGGFYGAPNREWDYDQSFNNPSNLPPLTPQFVYVKQESFIRTFGDDL